MGKRVVMWLVCVGAVKALIPTPGHVMEWVEYAMAGVLGMVAYLLWRLEDGKGTEQATSADEA